MYYNYYYVSALSFIEIICIAYDENDTCQSIAEQNSNVETNDFHYSTYGQVYTSFLREVLMKLDDLQDGIPNDATERMKCYKDQKIIDLTKMHNNYESSRLQWYFETKVNGLANVLGKMELFLRCPFGGGSCSNLFVSFLHCFQHQKYLQNYYYNYGGR